MVVIAYGGRLRSFRINYPQGEPSALLCFIRVVTCAPESCLTILYVCFPYFPHFPSFWGNGEISRVENGLAEGDAFAGCVETEGCGLVGGVLVKVAGFFVFLAEVHREEVFYGYVFHE